MMWLLQMPWLWWGFLWCFLQFTTGDLELNFNVTGSSDGSTGRVEIMVEGKWRVVCSSGWNGTAALVVCRQLHFSDGVIRVHLATNSPVPTHPLTVKCSSQDCRLRDCIHPSLTSECLPSSLLAYFECFDFKEQDQKIMDVRLSGENGDTLILSGVLEANINGSWGSVCSTDLIKYDVSSVVCRQLGLAGGRQQWISFGLSKTSKLIGKVECTGQECGLNDCKTDNSFDPNSCSRIGVNCQAGKPHVPIILETSNYTSALGNLTAPPVTADTVARARAILQQPGDLTAADVVKTATIIEQTLQLPNISLEMAEDILSIFDLVSGLEESVLQQSNEAADTTYRLIKSVEHLADKVSLDNGIVRLQTPGTVLQVWNLTLAAAMGPSDVLGLTLTPDGEIVDVNDTLSGQLTTAAIFLPREAFVRIVDDNQGSDVRMSATILKQTELFQERTNSRHSASESTTHVSHTGDDDTEPEEAVNRSSWARAREETSELSSKVVSMKITVDRRSITDLSSYGNYSVSSVFSMTKPEGAELMTRPDLGQLHCVFWDWGLQEGLGQWSRDGCDQWAVKPDNATVHCRCDHLTHFAVIMTFSGSPEVSKEQSVHEKVLNIITTVGLSLSIIGNALTSITFLLVKHLQKSLPHQALFNLSLSMLLSWVVFLSGIESVENRVTCVLVAALLHYFILVSFLWMLVQGVLLYVLLVLARQRPYSRFMLQAGLPAWGMPGVIVITVLSVDVDLYDGGYNYCWMKLITFYVAFLVPVGLVVVINLVIYIAVVVTLCRRPVLGSTSSAHSASSHRAFNVRASGSCFVVLGLNWVFAFFAVAEARLVFQYLFTCTAVLQGFLIFVLFTARDPDVRNFFLRKLGKDTSSETTRSSQRRITKSTQLGDNRTISRRSQSPEGQIDTRKTQDIT